MDTVRGLMAALKADELTIDEVVERLRLIYWVPRPRARGLSESYRRADEMPKDDDTFWIDLAHTQHLIKYDVYTQLIHALAESPGYAVTPPSSLTSGSPFPRAARK